MKIFIWKHLEMMSRHWHSDGGVVVFADTIEEARELFCKTAIKKYVEDEWDIKTIPPDEIFTVVGGDGPKEKVITFPDAGCC